jgi:CheY-like chemotaxis protein
MPRILLVEDNEMNRDMLSRRLRRRGYEVPIAVDGSEAVNQTRAERPDLVLVDMSLPVIDGWEATRRLRADADVASTPFIALTDHAMAGDKGRALQVGCDDYETKPVDIDRLVATIDALLEKKGRQEPKEA